MGRVKRKGCYEYDVEWHQNASALVVAKVAEKVLLEDAPIRETVESWPDIMDFMILAKVPRSSYLRWGDQQVHSAPIRQFDGLGTGLGLADRNVC